MAMTGNGGSEETLRMKWVFAIGLVALSLGIGTFNVWGGWKVSENVSWTITVAGAETMMFMALALVVIAPTWPRRFVGIIITIALAWFCVQNGKFAVKEMFSELFKDEQGQYIDPDTLRAQAAVLEKQIPKQEAAATKAENKRGEDLAEVRRDIAALENEQALMLVEIADPNRFSQQVLRAQQSLQARGEYGGNLDGLYGELTRDAMLSRGSVITRELDILKRQEAALNPTAATGTDEVSLEDIGSVQVVLTPAQKTEAAAELLKERAKTIEERLDWAERALWIIEAARAFSFWAFLMTVTSQSVNLRWPWAKDEPDAQQETSDLEPENDNKPEVDPNAPMTPEEKGGKGNEAKEAYENAQQALKVIIGPTLTTDLGDAA